MLRFVTISIGLLLLTHIASAQTLSDAEADAMIAAQERAKIERYEARMAELEKAEVISEGRNVMPNGQEVIVREVRPSAKEVEQPKDTPIAQQTTPTPEQIAAWQAKAGKLTEALMLSATVYDRKVTRVSWRYKTEEFIAYSNADFNYLSGVHTVETDTHRISFFMGIGNSTLETNPYPRETIPLPSAFASDSSEYILTKGDTNNEAALRGLTALLAHYDENLTDLKVAYQRRNALNAAQKRYENANPKEPEPFIIQFRVPDQNKREEAK